MGPQYKNIPSFPSLFPRNPNPKALQKPGQLGITVKFALLGSTACLLGKVTTLEPCPAAGWNYCSGSRPTGFGLQHWHQARGGGDWCKTWQCSIYHL